MAFRFIRTLIFALTALCASQAVSCEEVRTAPLTIYAFGGAADIWSTRSLPPFNDRSPIGPVVGPILSSMALAGADALLQSKGHHAAVKVLRVVYVVGITAVVVNNRRYR